MLPVNKRQGHIRAFCSAVTYSEFYLCRWPTPLYQTGSLRINATFEVSSFIPDFHACHIEHNKIYSEYKDIAKYLFICILSLRL